MQSFRNASAKSFAAMMEGDPDQMLMLIKSLYMGGLDSNDVRQALRTLDIPESKKNMIAGKKIQPMCPWEAYNTTQQVSTQQVEETLNMAIIKRGDLAVSAPGNFIYMKQFWAGAPTGMFAEIPNGRVIPLPGAFGSGTPQFGMQIIFGSGSQTMGGVDPATGMYGGLWGIPALQVPTSASIQPPNTAQGNGGIFLIKPQSITPYVQPGANPAYTAVMVRLSSDNQLQRSESLSDNYTEGRMICCTGKQSLNMNITSTVTSGSGTISQVQTTRIAGITQAALRQQGGDKAAYTDYMGSSIVNGDQVSNGLRFIQSTQVLQEMQPVDFNKVGGSGLAGIIEELDVIYLPPSGVSGTWGASATSGQGYQAAVPAQTGLQGPFLLNGIYDKMVGAYMAGRFYSDRFSIAFEYAQSPSLNITACRTGDPTLTSAICNTYPQQILSQDNCNTYSKVKTVQLPVVDELFPPQYHLEWTIGMGAARSMSFGNAVDLWVQILPDGSPNFTSRTTGLGVWGLTGADSSNSTFGPTGVIVGGMPQTFQWEHKPKHPEGEDVSIYEFTYAGTLFLFNSMADAQMTCTVSLQGDNLYDTGVNYPAVMSRIDGAVEGQFMTINVNEYWEVVANEQTNAIVKNQQIQPPMVDDGFARLLKALWADNELKWFSNCFVNSVYMSNVAEVACWETIDDMWEFFAKSGFLESPGAKGRITGKRKDRGEESVPQIDWARDSKPLAMLSDGQMMCDGQMMGDGSMMGNGRMMLCDRPDRYEEDMGYNDDDFEDGEDGGVEAGSRFWDFAKRAAVAGLKKAAPLALNVAHREIAKRIANAEQPFVQGDNVTPFQGNFNERAGYTITGRPWASMGYFGVMKNAETERSVSIQDYSKQLGLKVYPIETFNEWCQRLSGKAPSQFTNIQQVALEQQKISEEIRRDGNTDKIRRVAYVRGFSAAGIPTLATNYLYLQAARSPYDFALVTGLLTSGDESAHTEVVLPANVFHHVMSLIRPAIHEYVTGETNTKPTVSRAMINEAHKIIRQFKRSYMSRHGFEAQTYGARILQETDRLFAMKPTSNQVYSGFVSSDVAKQYRRPTMKEKQLILNNDPRALRDRAPTLAGYASEYPSRIANMSGGPVPRLVKGEEDEYTRNIVARARTRQAE